MSKSNVKNKSRKNKGEHILNKSAKCYDLLHRDNCLPIPYFSIYIKLP